MKLVDRIKDMIITGGRNVHSAEVERALTLEQTSIGRAQTVERSQRQGGEQLSQIRWGLAPGAAGGVGRHQGVRCANGRGQHLTCVTGVAGVQPGDPVLNVLVLTSREAAAEVAVEDVVLALPDVGQARAIQTQLHVGLDQSPEVGGGVVAGGLDVQEHRVDRLIHQRGEDLLFAAEVPVDAGTNDPGLLADRIDPDTVEASLGEQFLGCLKDLLLTAHAVILRRGGPLAAIAPWLNTSRERGCSLLAKRSSHFDEVGAVLSQALCCRFSVQLVGELAMVRVAQQGLGRSH